jgi:hypothetical protein
MVADLERRHVLKLLGAQADRPQAANQLRMLLRLLMAHAVEIEMRSDDPTRDIKREGSQHFTPSLDRGRDCPI